MAPDGLALMLTAGVTELFTDIVMVLEVAVVGLAQVEFDVIKQLIASPSTNELVTKDDPIETLIPFFFH